jgi:hypothetical protein
MIDIDRWQMQFLDTLQAYFGARVWFVGLQGSYSRGEATESSDLDMVVILDTLSAQDIQTYHSMLDTLPHRKLICGFLSGKAEILNWAPSDLFQFYYDTTPIMGSLDELLTHIDAEAVTESILLSVCNIFHGCVHNMLYEKDPEMLKELYNCASFVVQAICYQQTGKYFRRQQDLRPVVSPEEQVIVDTFLNLKNGMPVDFQVQSEMLFAWAQNWITKLK